MREIQDFINSCFDCPHARQDDHNNYNCGHVDGDSPRIATEPQWEKLGPTVPIPSGCPLPDKTK